MNFQASNIWCVGRNYSEHAKELGNAVPTTPLIFLKAGSSVAKSKETFALPFWSDEVHHEIELALRLDDKLQVSHAAVALDLTERKAQTEAKNAGKPWTLAKSFKEATVISNFFQITSLKELENLTLSLKVNGVEKQHGSTDQMIFKVPELLQYILAHFPVVPGDWILTGTPSGVGPLHPGDTVRAEIEGKVSAEWRVEKAKSL